MSISHLSSATRLCEALRAGDVSASELARRCIDRIERDTEINAVVVRRFERALEDAAGADAALGRGEPLGPLHGLPVTVKEPFDVAGLPTSWGLPPHADHVAAQDAAAVAAGMTALERAAFRGMWQRLFQSWDVLVCPIMATAATPHDDHPAMARTVQVNGAPQPMLQQVFWASLASLANLPATVFPAGLTTTTPQLPIGLQVIGPEGADYDTIAVAGMLGELMGEVRYSG